MVRVRVMVRIRVSASAMYALIWLKTCTERGGIELFPGIWQHRNALNALHKDSR